MLTRRAMLAAPALIGPFAPFGVTARAASYPSGPVKLIVNFPPGGSLDTITRAVAQRLQRQLGKSVVVEDRPGASGVLGTGIVAKAAPDGLTLLSSASALAANPTLFKSLPFDTLRDLQAVSLVFRTPLVLVVNPNLPIHSIKELIALLKEKPDQINFGHGGPGSAIHLAAELFQVMTRTKMIGVGYRGAPPALIDVIAGRVSLMFADVGAAVAQIKAGQVRALGVSSAEPVPVLPDIPTIADAGVPGFDAVGWTLICAPAATPKLIIDRLASELSAVAQTPDVQSLIIKLGNLPVNSPSPVDLQAFLASEIDRWGKLVERAGIAKSL